MAEASIPNVYSNSQENSGSYTKYDAERLIFMTKKKCFKSSKNKKKTPQQLYNSY